VLTPAHDEFHEFHELHSRLLSWRCKFALLNDIDDEQFNTRRLLLLKVSAVAHLNAEG
jgi:hypothetical protein